MESVTEILHNIKNFKNQIQQMDQRIRLYISDRKKYRNPFPEDLVTKIRNYETQLHRYLKGFQNTEIELWLDNLMYSLLVHEKIWKRWLEEDSQRSGQAGADDQSPDSDSGEYSPLIEKAFQLEKKQWSQLGVSGTETKEELADRLLRQYKEARNNLKSNEKIVLSYTSREHKVEIKVKPGS